jgi:hypothetical protein
MTAPVNTVAPAVTGTAAVGVTLSLSTGTWTGGVDSYAYAWLRGSDVISGETAATYEVTLDDIGYTLKGRVTATNVDGSTAADSVATASVPSLDDPFLDPSRRATVEAMLASVESAISTALETGRTEYEFQFAGGSGRRMKFSTLSELFEARDKLRAELRSIIAAERAGAGLGNPRKHFVRFVGA